MWTGEREGGVKEQRGGVKQRQCQDRGGGGNERGKEREEGQLGVCCNCKRGGKKVGIVLYIPLENPNYDQAKFPFSHSFLPPPPSLYKHQHTCSEFVDESLASVSAFAEERPNLHCYIDVITKFLRGGERGKKATELFQTILTSTDITEFSGKIPNGLSLLAHRFYPHPQDSIHRADTGHVQER